MGQVRFSLKLQDVPPWIGCCLGANHCPPRGSKQGSGLQWPGWKHSSTDFLGWEEGQANYTPVLCLITASLIGKNKSDSVADLLLLLGLPSKEILQRTEQLKLLQEQLLCCVSRSISPILFVPMDSSPPWNSPGKNTGVSRHSLLQGIFPIQESNLGLPNCRQILYHLSHHRSKNSCSVAQLCPTLCNLMDCNTRGLPVLHHFQSLLKLVAPLSQ